VHPFRIAAMNASRHAPALLALCLLSAAAAASAGNREPRMHGPGGDGGECTQAEAGAVPDAAPAATTTTAKPGTAPAVKPPATTHIKPAITVRGGSDDGSSVHAPRWHSFLPGMFR
jgi:hypothetical protein